MPPSNPNLEQKQIPPDWLYFEDEEESSVHLSDYLHVLTKHKWLILAFLFIAVTLTMYITFNIEPIYSATARMVIDGERKKSPVTGEPIDNMGFVSEKYAFNTHINLISSEPVIEKVIRTLKIGGLENESKEQSSGVKSLRDIALKIKKNVTILLGGTEKNRKIPIDEKDMLIRELKKLIKVNGIRDTNIVRISVHNNDPVLAKDIANTLAKAYIEFNIGNKLDSSSDNLKWLQSQLYETKKNLEDAEKEFMAYKERSLVFSVEGKLTMITKKMEEFNEAYLVARNRRLELDANLAELKKSMKSGKDIYKVRSFFKSPLIEDLYSQLLSLEVELNRLGKVFKSKHPKLIQIRGTMEDTRNKLREEIEKEIENVKAERSVLRGKEKVLLKTISEFEKDAIETNKNQLEYAILQRNVNTYQQLYNMLLSKIKEADVTSSMDVSNIRIVEKAKIPVSPIKPKKKLNFILSVVVGLMMGAGLAFLSEYMDRSIRSEEDVQKYLGLPVLGVIPEADKRK